jgi:hypothetical protein
MKSSCSKWQETSTGVYHNVHLGRHLSLRSRVGAVFLRLVDVDDLTRALLTPLPETLTPHKRRRIEKMSNDAARTDASSKMQDDDEPDEWCVRPIAVCVGDCGPGGTLVDGESLANDHVKGQADIQHGMRRYADISVQGG